MITQSKAWEKYNTLANQLRDAIVQRVADFIGNLPNKEFIFKDYNLEECPNSNSGIIRGLSLEDNEIKIIMADEVGGIGINFSLYSEQVHLVDLLVILENLETYARGV